ncbi:RNA-binding S4 domain-containing protein [Seohaeicola sp.]|jgi:ribosome-associated heat shock protein Hsp15|nr:RNA-binding protein S4 [Rhodobacteraceae bacterium EhC02]
MRIDKWLWHARFFKTRTLAAAIVSAGHVRINSVKASKPAQGIAPGDVLTFMQGDHVRVVRVLAHGVRRGPATEAQTLYEDMTPAREDVPSVPQPQDGGRPTKRDRRIFDLDRRRMLE